MTGVPEGWVFQPGDKVTIEGVVTHGVDKEGDIRLEFGLRPSAMCWVRPAVVASVSRPVPQPPEGCTMVLEPYYEALWVLRSSSSTWRCLTVHRAELTWEKLIAEFPDLRPVTVGEAITR